MRILEDIPLHEKYTVNPITQCWIYLGDIDPYGYGRENYRKAHAVYWEMAHGPVPDGLVLDHLCVRRNCVNPSHLEPVTVAENQNRAVPYRKLQRKQSTKCRRGHEYVEGSFSLHYRLTPNGVPVMDRTCLVCQRLTRAARVARRAK